MNGKPENQKNTGGRKSPGGPRGSNNLYWIYALILLFIIVATYFFPSGASPKSITERKFWDDLVAQSHVKEVLVINKKTAEVYLSEDALNNVSEYQKLFPPKSSKRRGPHYSFEIGSIDNFAEKADEKKVAVRYETKTDYLSTILQFLLPIGILIALWIFFMRRIGGGGAGGQIFNIGKSKALLYDKENKVNVTFNDVAGLEEAKEEVKEVVEFLKNPSKFTRLGGHIPKGVLLVGPPGTGKTLLAKAVAGEAKVPFFSLSGSDFVEMFVGVGAARVRDLFKQAKEKAPCIVFVDEIDAIGRSRGRNNFTGGNDERENTLNQLLVEMDGFNSDTGVILMAATNRPDVLDSALLRPGRFDRQIAIDQPDIKGREQIFRVHLKKLKLAEDVHPQRLAAQTPGFVGADIMNLCNEAALIAARRNKESVEMIDFLDAVDRVIGGLEKKNKIISPEEKKIVAYHEAGHAVSGWFLEHADPLVKVTIVPRGMAGGYARYAPKEKMITRTEELIDKMCMALGGRAAEQIVFGKISTGAVGDLDQITKMAYAMVTIYGMNEKVGNISFMDRNGEFSFSKPYSEETARMIDEEVRALIEKAYHRTIDLLNKHRDELDAVANHLIEKEVLFKEDMEKLIGERPWGYPEDWGDVVSPAKLNGNGNGNGTHIEAKKEETPTTPPPAKEEKPQDEPPKDEAGDSGEGAPDPEPIDPPQN